MKATIAVLLGVPKYDSLPDLPGCRGDIEALGTVLSESEKFTEVLVLDGSETYSKTKKKLGDFVRGFQSAPVDEFLFYFTGHGNVIDDEFRFLLRDFDSKRPNATSISNSDLDDWVRSLRPDLYCKVVDACHSGVAYVKDSEVLKRILEKNRSEFKKCYFLFSSQNDQSSLADEGISFFTRAIIRSIVTYPEDSIGYNDLASAVADEFRSGSEQKPYFVHQANLTEVFVDISPRMRERLQLFLPSPDNRLPRDQLEEAPSSLEERVKRDAQHYLTREEAVAFLDRLRGTLTPESIGGPTKDLYEFELSEVPKVTIGETYIANWLSQRGESRFFVDIERYTYYTDFAGNVLDDSEVQSMRLQNRFSFGVFGSLYQQKRRISGFELTESASWEVLKLIATPKYTNLPQWELQVSYALGPKEIAVFGAIARLHRSGWQSFKPTGKVDWLIDMVDKASLGEAAIAGRMIERFEEHVAESLAMQFVSNAPSS